MADLLTVLERCGELRGVRLAYVGDGFNVAQSLAEACALSGVRFAMASPKGYELPPGIVRAIQDMAKATGGSIEVFDEAADAVRDADVVYTDVWTSMGQEDTYAQRKEAFAGYSVTADLMALAKPEAIFMHDLPAHRGDEVTDDVIEGAQSVVFDQAENRLHAQKAILALVASEHAL
jgi:ornithine carbamoyltransferase